MMVSTDMIQLHLTVNGKKQSIQSHPGKSLLYLIREDLGLRGTKDGCQIGECGACTVLLDGVPVNACLTLASQVDGREVFTIEGMAQNGKLHPLQRAFVEEGAVQCGFCTPGAILSAYALLKTINVPSEEEVRDALVGNLCRCTGYSKIINAVLKAARVDQNG